MPGIAGTPPAHPVSSPEGPVMRMRDLIYGLLAENPEANELVERLDPAIADELHAVVAHRRIATVDFVAQVLMELALEHADAVWRAAVTQRAGLRRNAEAAELGDILVRAMRRHLQAEAAITCAVPVQQMSLGQYRVGHPYVQG